MRIVAFALSVCFLAFPFTFAHGAESRASIRYAGASFTLGSDLATIKALFPKMQKGVAQLDMWNAATQVPIFVQSPDEEVYTLNNEADQTALYFAFSKGVLTKASIVCNTNFPPPKLLKVGEWLNDAYDFMVKSKKTGETRTLVTPGMKITNVTWGGGGEDGGGDTCDAYAFEAVSTATATPNDAKAIQQGQVKRIGSRVWLVKPLVNEKVKRPAFTYADAEKACRELTITPWTGKWRLATSEEMKADLFRQDPNGRRNMIDGIEGDAGNYAVYWVSDKPNGLPHKDRSSGYGYTACAFQLSTWNFGFRCTEQGSGNYGRSSWGASDDHDTAMARCVANE